MNKTQLNLWLTRLAWGLIGMNTMLICLIPTGIKSTNMLILMLLYLLWLISSSGLAVTWLILRYRSLFHNWWALGLPLIFFILGTLSIQNVITIENDNLAFFLSVLFLVSYWGIGISIAIFLWRHDVGLPLVAWWLVAIIWVLTFAWRLQGNLIDLWLVPLEKKGQPSPIWWFSLLQCFSCWLIPLGILSFLGHTTRLLLKEFG